MFDSVITTIFSLPTLIGLCIFEFIKDPAKIEKWLALFLRTFRFLWKGKKVFEKKYVKLDVQGRLNCFLKEVRDEIRNSPIRRVQLNFLSEDEHIKVTREKFLKRGKLVIKLNKSEDQDKNFLNAALIMISECVLPNTRKYLTPSQKKAIDLQTCHKFFQSQKQKLQKSFEDKFVSECQKNPTIADLIDKFIQIDRAGLFFPLLVQELHFLFDKVIVTRDPQIIYREVDALISFLVDFVEDRKKGEDRELRFTGTFSRINILIIGIQQKMFFQGIMPYVKRIRECQNLTIESVYILSPNKLRAINFVNRVILAVRDKWHYVDEFIYMRLAEGLSSKKSNLVILRNKRIQKTITDSGRIPEAKKTISTPKVKLSESKFKMKKVDTSTKSSN